MILIYYFWRSGFWFLKLIIADWLFSGANILLTKKSWRHFIRFAWWTPWDCRCHRLMDFLCFGEGSGAWKAAIKTDKSTSSCFSVNDHKYTHQYTPEHPHPHPYTCGSAQQKRTLRNMYDSRGKIYSRDDIAPQDSMAELCKYEYIFFRFFFVVSASR